MSSIYLPHLELEKKAIMRLKTFEPKTEGYYGCYSGGKDSDCIKILSSLADVKVDWEHNLTTVDAPETVQYIKSQKDVHISVPEKSMWRLIVEKGIPPTRLVRYCCTDLKEKVGKGRVKITGVRWAESHNRAVNNGVAKIIGKSKTVEKMASDLDADYFISKSGGLVLNTDNDVSRRMVEQCYRTTSTMVNPILEWEDRDVWTFLKYYGCNSNPLYECGFNRIGCIGCPMASKHRYFEFERYPKYKENYIKAFDRMLITLKAKGLNNKNCWQSGEEVFKWWMGEDVNQMSLFTEELGGAQC